MDRLKELQENGHHNSGSVQPRSKYSLAPGSEAISANWPPPLVDNNGTLVLAQSTRISHGYSPKRQAGQLYC